MIIKNNNTFHLQGKNTSYIMVVNETGDLLHYHFGKKLSDRDYSEKLIKCSFGYICNDENDICLETTLQEYPAYGYTDLRMPAYSVQNKYGNSVSRLIYKDYSIKENEVSYIEGMPSIFKSNKTAQTLEITLCDDSIGLEVILLYTVFDEYDIILRSSKFVNKSGEKMTLDTAYSASVDFEKRGFDLIYFPGAWCREREFIRTKINLGEKNRYLKRKRG